MKERIESLDYLRGVMALFVMIFHYTLWAKIQVSHDSMISKMGIYAVTAFYVLSGVSMSVVYVLGRHSIGVRDFYLRRLFRIIPVFWLALVCTVSLKFANFVFSGKEFDVTLFSFAINFSLLFSVLDPNAYIPIGAWSIGNEIVFYLMFPVFALMFFKHKISLYMIIVISFIIYCFFTFVFFIPGFSLQSVWHYYVNPLNHFFCFMVGVSIPLFFKRDISNQRKSVFIVLCTVTFVFSFLMFLPTYGQDYFYLGGYYRLFYTFLIILLVGVVYKYGVNTTGIVSSIFRTLGDWCYSLYLLHPIVFFPVSVVLGLFNISGVYVVVVSFMFTFSLCYFTYKYVEVPFINIGRRISATKNWK